MVLNDVDLVDRFFNGICGYRAQYYLSGQNGLSANKRALQELEPKLLQAAKTAEIKARDPNDETRELVMTEEPVQQSLRLPSAKIWGDETQGELRRVTVENQSPIPQIVATRWVANAESGIEKARKGIKAPRFHTLKFHGAFLKDGEERVPANKLTRSEDIHKWGFA